MRRPLGAALLIGIAAAIGACQSSDHEQPGATVTKDYKVGDFSKIESAGSYDVTVTTGGAASVRAKGPENVLKHLRIQVNGDTLEISPDKSRHFNWGRGANVTIAITVPQLSGASLAGSGNLSVDKVAGEAFEGNIAGSGALNLPSVKVTNAKFNIAGSGTATVGGSAANAEYSIAGSGDVDAARLEAQDVEVNVAGSGNIRAHALRTVDGVIMGSGNVTVSGGGKCTVQKMGSGSIDCS